MVGLGTSFPPTKGWVLAAFVLASLLGCGEAVPEVSNVDELSARASGHIENIDADLGPRTSATAEELAAARYLQGSLESFGYTAELQDFSVLKLAEEGEFLSVEGLDSGTFTARPVDGTKEGVAFGQLKYVGTRASAGEDLTGSIALIEKSEVPVGQAVRSVLDAGAVGSVIFNDQPGMPSESFGGRMDAIVVGISQADGRTLVDALQHDPVTAALRLVATEQASQNVVAVKPGTSDRIVVLGAHYDAVPDSPGANDNGSGIAVILTIAEELADRDLPYELRIVLFGSEELGLHGSQHYVSTLTLDEIDRTLLMLNFDAVGTGKLEATGNTVVLDVLRDIAESEGFDMRAGLAPRGASSDHVSFELAGVPSAIVYGSDISRIHTPEDTIEWVDPDLLGRAVMVGIQGLLGRFDQLEE